MSGDRAAAAAQLRCALVSTAGELLLRKDGNLIDQYDVVARMGQSEMGAEYEEHVGTSATSVCSEMLRRPKAAVPQPSPAQSFGPSNLYGFPYVVSKFYHVQLPAASGRAKRLSYSNSGLNPLQLSLHTDRADLLDFPSSRYVLGTGKDTQLRLMFLPLPDAGHRDPRRIVQ